jgi:hypothetical protein
VAWIFVCCECCVLSGRGLCDEFITCPEESYRLWRVIVCDLENLEHEETKSPLPGCENTTTVGCNARKTNKQTIQRTGRHCFRQLFGNDSCYGNKIWYIFMCKG